MAGSISTRLDEEEFLDMADYYYVTTRPGSTTTLSTNTHLRRREGTPGPRWRPSTLRECDDSGSASGGGVDEAHQYDTVDGQTFPRILVDPLKSPSSISLESYSDDTHTFRTATARDIAISSLNTLPQRILIPPINPVLRSSPSLTTKLSRPISTASVVSGSCFGIICVPRWNMKTSSRPGSRPRKQKKLQAAQSVGHGTGESSRPPNVSSTIPLDSSQSGGEYLSLPPASINPLLVGLDYDYHLAVEVLINGPDSETRAMP